MITGHYTCTMRYLLNRFSDLTGQRYTEAKIDYTTSVPSQFAIYVQHYLRCTYLFVSTFAKYSSWTFHLMRNVNEHKFDGRKKERKTFFQRKPKAPIELCGAHKFKMLKC